MKRVLVTVLLCLLTAIPCISGTTPSMTGEVNIVDGVNEYVYTLTNDLDTGMYAYGFSIFMPKDGALAVTNAWCSREGWFVDRYVQGDYAYWRCGVRYTYLLQGESLTLKLTTSADVPTSYNYTPPNWSSNWRWFDWGGGPGFGNSVLPVPVPEPSSILALAGGIAGLGGLALRRRRSTRQA
jgi:hypothetical protein